MSQFQEQLEGVPGYDIAMDKYNEYAEGHFNNTNPFEDEEGNKRELDPLHNTEAERRVWKQVQRSAWVHDRCFLGSCGVGMDCGIGLVPVAVFFLPGLGPLLTYVIHARLVSIAQDSLHLPSQLTAKLHSNILIDLLLSLLPVIGAFFAWLNGCSTRNAGMIYVFLRTSAEKRAMGQAPTYVGRVRPGARPGPPQTAGANGAEPFEGITATQGSRATPKKSRLGRHKEPKESINIGQQQSGIR